MLLSTQSEVLSYLPQRPPFVLVDRLESSSPAGAVTGFEVPASSPVVERGRLTDAGLLEHCAQSAALNMGYQRVANRLPVVVGFIGSLDKFEIRRLPRCGELLRTTVTVEAEAGPVTLLACQVTVGDEQIAQGKLKVALQA